MPTTARDRLVTTARTLFAAQGVGPTSPRQVMEASGVGQGSLYHHFPTKLELAVAAVSATVEEALASALRELSGPAPARDRVLAYLERPRDALGGCRVGRLTSDQTVMDEPTLHTAVGTYFRHLVEALTDVFAETGLPRAAAHDRASAAVAVVQGGYVLARATGDPEAMRAALRGLVTMLDGPEPDRAADQEDP